MISSHPLSFELARQIGNLFFAVAFSDNNIASEENDRLRLLLKSQWSHYDMKMIAEIEKEFDEAQREGRSAEDCFRGFVRYLQNNSSEFTKELRSLILSSCTELAYAFAKLNKSELHYLARLNLEMKRIAL